MSPSAPERRSRFRALLAVVALLAAAVVISAMFLSHGSNSAPRTREVRLGADASSNERRPQGNDSAVRKRLTLALEQGVRTAAGLGGSVEASVMLGPWRDPVVVTSDRDGEQRPLRAWSLSKVFTFVALLRELGWGTTAGRAPSPEVDAALAGAITRSENCRQRRIVLELQRVVGGSPLAARAAVVGTLARSGARVRVAADAPAPETMCVGFLRTQRGLRDPLGPGLLLGTSTWRIADAVRFVHALGTNRYGQALSKRVLSLMRVRKARTREAPPGDFTAPLDWGAGRALAALQPAYKAGWGGALQGDFFAGQIAVLNLPRGGTAAVAVMFHPREQPPKDDPGLTPAPEAIETVMTALAHELERQ